MPPASTIKDKLEIMRDEMVQSISNIVVNELKDESETADIIIAAAKTDNQ